MTREELDFIGSMNMCDEISDEAYKKIVCHCREQEPKYCDRNICVSNEYNGIGCDDCEVTKSQEPKTVAILVNKFNLGDDVVYGTDGNLYKITVSSGNECEQAPCEDAISRQAVLDIVNELERLASDRVRDTSSSLGNGLYTWINPAYTRYSTQLSERSQFKTMIQTMPPVTPQPKTGK